MTIRFVLAGAVIAATLLGGRHLAAQQMSPYGPMAAYPPMVPTRPAASPMPPVFDVRQTAMNQQTVSDEVPECPSGPGVGRAYGVSMPCLAHNFSVWGEYLYLRARNAEVAFGVPTDEGLPTGAVGLTDPNFSSGVRLGLEYVLDGYTSVSAQYSWFETSGDNAVESTTANIQPLIAEDAMRPDYRAAHASQRIRFDWLDADYRSVLDCYGNQQITFLAGTRVGQYSQNFSADFTNQGRVTSALSDIDFDGAGVRLGLEAERPTRSRRWFAYGKTAASLVAGDFTADARVDDNELGTVVNTTWEAGRIVPMLDLELGAGWQSRCGTWRVSGGYLFSAWYNTVRTDEWLEAVQSNNYVGLSDTLTFDGVVVRCEGRF